jgi:hypothetical protein
MAEINASEYFKAGGNTVANLVGITPDQDGATYDAISFFNDWEVSAGVPTAGGKFEFQKNRAKTQHNGSTIISPTVPWNGKQSTLSAFEAKTGETDPFGFGCWVAIDQTGILGGGGVVSGLLVNASASGTVTIDLAQYSAAELTVTGNLTIAFSSLPAINTQNKFTLTIINGGAFTVTHPVGTRWGGSGVVGSAPTLQATGTDKIVYDIYNDGAVVYDGAYIGRYA